MKYCWSREYIVSVSSNFLTQISCGIKTKCRKTRAMQRDFTIVDSLALRQCDTSMIPDTHLLKLLFLARYTSRSIYQSSMCDNQSASSCGLASWMRPQQCDTSMIPDAHLLKLLFLARYYPSLNLLAFLSISVVLQTRFLDARIKNICACSVSLEICQL